jgi:hypothetical protein
MLWSALLISLRMSGKKTRRRHAASLRMIPGVEGLENRSVPAVAMSSTSALVDLTPTPPVVSTGAAAVTATTAEFVASLELKGTVSESNGTSTSSAHFDVTKTVDLTLVNGSAGAYLEHADDFTLKVGASKLDVDIDLEGKVDVHTNAAGDEVVDLTYTDTAHLTQSGDPATAALDFHGLLGLSPLAAPTAIPLASLTVTDDASLQTSTGDPTTHLNVYGGAHEGWDVTTNDGNFSEHDHSGLVQGTSDVEAYGPIYMYFDGVTGSTTPTRIDLDSASNLSLLASADSADSKLALDATGDFADFKVHGKTHLEDNQGDTTAHIDLHVTGPVTSFEVERNLSLTWDGGAGDTATDHEDVSIPAPTVSPSAEADTATGGTVTADLDSTFSLTTGGSTDEITHELEQTGEPILFDFTDTLPPTIPPAT